MKIHQNLDNLNIKHAVVTIGMFDGVHKGHHMILDRVKEVAKIHNGESVVVTFWPHPRIVLDPENSSLRYLSTIKEKIKLLEDADIDHVVIINFTKGFAQKTANEFTEEILVDKINVKYLILGYDHRFGKDRKGSLEDMQLCAAIMDFGIEKLNALSIGTEIISSTKIREAIESGNIEKANSYLGYDYFILGQVVKGNKIGRSIGFPTANIKIQDQHKQKPGIGVYAVYILFENNLYRGMLNIGFRPTIEEKTKYKTTEVHIFNFNKNIYEKEVLVIFKKKIRKEYKFTDIEALKIQLENDKILVLDYFDSQKESSNNLLNK